MTIGDVKNELYKRIELQNLRIKTFVFGAEQIKDHKRIIELNININNNDFILVVVEQKKIGVFWNNIKFKAFTKIDLKIYNYL